jgi:hypothetical protein
VNARCKGISINQLPIGRTRTFRVKSAVLLAVCLAVVLGSTVERSAAAGPLPDRPLPVVSLVSLISRPEKYDGQRVVVKGYATFGFENSYLYLSPYDAQHSIGENAIWLQFKESQFRNWRSLDHQTIEVEGTFHVPKNAAYWTNYPNGYVGEITRLQLGNPPIPSTVFGPAR